MYSQQKSMIQKLLDENSQLILLILDLLAKGKQHECLEHQRTLYRNLTYLIQFDPTASHHLNSLPPPDTFIQTQSLITNGQSDQIYQTQTNSPTPSNILNSSSSTSINKPTISQQRSSYSIQTNSYGQYSISHPHQNYLIQQQWQNQSRAPIQQQIPPQT